MKLFTSFFNWVDVNDDRREIAEMVQEFMLNLFGDDVPLHYGKLRCNRDIQFRM